MTFSGVFLKNFEVFWNVVRHFYFSVRYILSIKTAANMKNISKHRHELLMVLINIIETPRYLSYHIFYSICYICYLIDWQKVRPPLCDVLRKSCDWLTLSNTRLSIIHTSNTSLPTQASCLKSLRGQRQILFVTNTLLTCFPIVFVSFTHIHTPTWVCQRFRLPRKGKAA